MVLALAVAATAPSPRKRPTQIVLIEPLSDCRMFDPSVGSANASSVLEIGPLVRSRWPDRPEGVAMVVATPYRRT